MHPTACYYCGYVSSAMTRDHLIPRSRGGSDAPENIVICCYRCNTLKGTKTEQEFRASFLPSPLFHRVRALEDRSSSLLPQRMYTLNGDTVAGIGRLVGPYGIAIYAALIALADEDGRVMLSQKRLSEYVGLGRTSVSQTIQKLRQGGFIDYVVMNRPDRTIISIFEVKIA